MVGESGEKGARTSTAGVHVIHDVWQAASLLVGLFGRDAGTYAAEKLARCVAERDLGGVTTWSLIGAQIDLLLKDYTDRQAS